MCVWGLMKSTLVQTDLYSQYLTKVGPLSSQNCFLLKSTRIWNKDTVGWGDGIPGSLTLPCSSSQDFCLGPPPHPQHGGLPDTDFPASALPAPADVGILWLPVFFPPLQGMPESLAALITAACLPQTLTSRQGPRHVAHVSWPDPPPLRPSFPLAYLRS